VLGFHTRRLAGCSGRFPQLGGHGSVTGGFP
jgi:hypothetical protein